jgi:hypothetical protein
MKAFSIVVLGLLIAGAAHAQTSGTRVTPCDPATPNNAICLTWVAPVSMSDGSALQPFTYRVEQQAGSGAFATIATGVTSLQQYVKNLAPGAYTFRVFANCATSCNESAASNLATKSATAPVVTPNPPVLTIAVVIGVNTAPVFRIVGVGPYTRGAEFGYVPVGIACNGDSVFQYRGLKFYRVDVQPAELWGTSDSANLAAPCKAAGG